MFEVISDGTRSAGILNVLLAAEYFRHVARQGARRAEQVHLEHEHVISVRALDNVLERRGRDQATTPEILVADLNHWQCGWQRTAGHDMFRLDRGLGTIEIDEVSGRDI